MKNRENMKFLGATLGYYLLVLGVVEWLGDSSIPRRCVATAIVLAYCGLDLHRHTAEVGRLRGRTRLRDLAWSYTYRLELPGQGDIDATSLAGILVQELKQVEIAQAPADRDGPVYLRASGPHRGRAQLRVERTPAGACIVVKVSPALYKATDGGRRLKLAADIESVLSAARLSVPDGQA